jgi:predicted ribonuclease toxin of YeeF-YezG toxin-antitoxin module
MNMNTAKNVFKAFAQSGIKGKTAAIFKRAASSTKSVYNRSRFENELAYKAVKGISSLAGTASFYGGHYAGKGINMMRTGIKRQLKFSPEKKAVHRKSPSKLGKKMGSYMGAAGLAGVISVGAVGMMSVGIMNGMNNAAKDIVLQRYMTDQRFARDILLQSRVGMSMGSNRMNQSGSTIGLSNALSRTRHGAR